MHKKPLVAVIILGLLLLTHSVVLAERSPLPKPQHSEGTLLPRIARGLVKDAPTAVESIPGNTSTLQLGVSRSGATFCDGDGYGGPLGQYSSWFFGDEFYAAYQDPESFGTCAGGSGLYTFDVTGVNWWVVDNVGGAIYEMQPLVYENAGDASCAVPGNVLCAGPLYTIDLTGNPAGGYIFSLPFTAECCSYYDYFAGVYVPTFTPLGIVVDDDGIDACFNYNDWGGGWADLSNYLVGSPFLWSEGIGWDQNTCPGIPGVCDWQSYNGGAAYLWADDGIFPHTGRFVRFDAAVSCTLMSADITVYGGGSVGTPTLRVRVYGSNGPVWSGRMYPDDFTFEEGSNFLGYIDIPWANITPFPGVTNVDFSSLGLPAFGPAGNFFISQSLSPLTPNPGTDVIAFLTDDGLSGASQGHSGAFRNGDWWYYDEYYGTDYGILMAAYVCCEQVDAVEVDCAAVGPDQWPTWAHDYNRSSASSISVGDPCLVTPAWYNDLADLNSFNEPVVADGRVYISDDATLYTFDLVTGAPGNSVTGLPYIFGGNRGNTTVHGLNAYVTGGQAQGISAWSADLATNYWVHSLGTGTPLNARNRFGVTTVLDAGGTEVVIVATEGGDLYAYETATGLLFAGWPTNPQQFNGEAIYHGPAFDGVNLYVATGGFGAPGAIYQVDPLTGAILGSYVPASPTEGFTGGVSLEGGFIYAATSDGNNGRRLKIDKASMTEVWAIGNERSLYGAPTIGRNFIYVPQDGSSGGVLVCDKNSGAALKNFADEGVGRVTQHVTLTCDNFLFAGDRSGNWHLLDVNNGTAAWSLAMPWSSIVNGTALATGVDGNDYAVVGLRSGGLVLWGACAAFKFNGPARPFAIQNVSSTLINVPFGSGAGNPYTEAGVLSNVGCADLNISTINFYDPLPDAAAKKFRQAESRYAAAQANVRVGADYVAYFENSQSKSQAMAQSWMRMSDNELTNADVAIDKAAAALRESKRNANRTTAMAAAGPRTSGYAITTPIPAGGSGDVTWMWDGTGLERGLDDEILEFITDDPFALLTGFQPALTINYVGGCLDDVTSIEWNTLGAANEYEIYNWGSMGASNGAIVAWGADPNDDGTNLYDGTFALAGDSSAAIGGAQFFSEVYGSLRRSFLPNPAPGSGVCGFDEYIDVPLGFKRTGGCPGTPEPILGAWTRTNFSDTNETAVAGTPLAAIGTNVTATAVGAYDPLYGDFLLMRWEVQNRDATDKGMVYGGTYMDFDVTPSYGNNAGRFSDNANGYFLWDSTAAGHAYGMLAYDIPSGYMGADASANPAHRIHVTSNGMRVYAGGSEIFDDDRDASWHLFVNYPASRLVDPSPDPDNGAGDAGGVLTNVGQNLGPNETVAFHQALYGVDASSNDENVIDAAATELSARAAKWAGFARGDANDDGVINLVDVCWVTSGNQIYPDTYNGDVDLSGTVDAGDAAYLLNYVTGIGPAPMGEWRFTF